MLAGGGLMGMRFRELWLLWRARIGSKKVLLLFDADADIDSLFHGTD